MKGLSDQELMRRSPSPRFRTIERGRSTTLYSYEQASECNSREYAEHLRRCKSSLDILIFVNVDCNEIENWLAYCKLLEEAGADGLSSTFRPTVLSPLREQVEERILEVVKAVREL